MKLKFLLCRLFVLLMYENMIINNNLKYNFIAQFLPFCLSATGISCSQMTFKMTDLGTFSKGGVEVKEQCQHCGLE